MERHATTDMPERKVVMSGIGNFQNKVNNMLSPDFNFQPDRPHAGKSEHADLTVRIPGFGADKVEVGFNGNVIGGSTNIGPKKLNWK